MRKLTSFCLAGLCAVCAVGTVGFGGCKNERSVNAKYEIVAELVPETATVTGTLKLEYINSSAEEISELKFNLYPNAYREDAVYKAVAPAYEKEAYYQGESFGEIVVSSVNGARSWRIGGEDKNILCVELEESIFPDEKTVVDIGFSTKLASVDHRTGVAERAVHLGNFYPQLCGRKDGAFVECVYYSDGDPFFSECADYKMTLLAPKEYLVASTCSVTAERTLESKKEYTMSATNVRDVMIVASDDMQVKTEKVGGVTLKYYYLNEKSVEERFQTVKECFSWFGEKFGAYPYAEYSVVETDFCYGGMEYPALTLVDGKIENGEFLRAVVHETAHQWWYAVVGSDQTTEAWQDEGLAEYSAALFFDEHDRYGLSKQVIVDEALKGYREYFRVYGSAFGETDTRMSRSLAEYLSEYEYRSIAYDKGAVLFDFVFKSVGEKKFFAALKRYYKDNAFRVATPHDLVAAFERSGVDVAGLFDGFLNGKGVI